jgi:hypothetical protein
MKALGPHEAQHYRQSNEDLSFLAAEVRSLAMQYIIGRAQGGLIRSTPTTKPGTTYIRNRLDDSYCKISDAYRSSAIQKIMDGERYQG